MYNLDFHIQSYEQDELFEGFLTEHEFDVYMVRVMKPLWKEQEDFQDKYAEVQYNFAQEAQFQQALGFEVNQTEKAIEFCKSLTYYEVKHLMSMRHSAFGEDNYVSFANEVYKLVDDFRVAYDPTIELK